MRSKRKPKKSPPPLEVSVTVSRNGAELQATVKWPEVKVTLATFLEVFREATKKYPELIVELSHVGGGSIQYSDDWSGGEDRKRKIGF